MHNYSHNRMFTFLSLFNIAFCNPLVPVQFDSWQSPVLDSMTTMMMMISTESYRVAAWE